MVMSNQNINLLVGKRLRKRTGISVKIPKSALKSAIWELSLASLPWRGRVK
jgi:hypothetical protein